jgi:hypothetical protein
MIIALVLQKHHRSYQGGGDNESWASCLCMLTGWKKGPVEEVPKTQALGLGLPITHLSVTNFRPWRRTQWLLDVCHHV